MQVYKISDMDRGWFVGDFEPSVFQNPFFEVAHHKHKKGESTQPHIHKISTELNYILEGELIASGQHLKTGDISNIGMVQMNYIIMIMTQMNGTIYQKILIIRMLLSV